MTILQVNGMKVRVRPSKVAGNISIPSSKSMAHRALICASLAQGESFLYGITPSKDIEATIACMTSLGAEITEEKEGYRIKGTDLKLEGQTPVLDCHESGSTLRFLIPIASLTHQKIIFKGQGRLMERPMDVYSDLFWKQGLFFKQDQEKIEIQGSIQAGKILLAGDVSSQFISGLLFALPLLKKDSTLEIVPPYESRSYVDLTMQMLKKFGIVIHTLDEYHYHIPGSQSYQAGNVQVEGDYSQMAFFGVLAAIQGKLSLFNMDPISLQGDKEILSFLKKAGALVSVHNDRVDVVKNHLKAQEIDLSNCPDLGPILCVLASYCLGTTHFWHAGRLRIKESDRVEAMETELKKWGVPISSTFDSITITGKKSYEKSPITINGHNDHRIVMAMTVFGLCAQAESIIEDAQAITKSYPTFFEDVLSIGGKVEIL